MTMSLIRFDKHHAAIGAGVLLAGLAAPAWADGPTAASLPGPPARIANHYDYRAFQPTQAEVCAAQGANGQAGGLNCPSPAGAAAERELARIRQQINETNAKYPPGYLEQSDRAPR